MTAIIYLILALIILSGIIYILFQSNRKKKKEITKLGDKVVELIATVADRDHIIKGIQEVNRDTAEKKKKIHTGDDNIDFNNSLDILQNLSAYDRTGKD